MQPKPDWRKQGHWLPGSRPGSWLFARLMPIIDRVAFRLSGGRLTAVSSVAGLPSIMLTTKGAKSGQPRTVTLLGIPDGEEFIVIGSNWGQKHHPAWIYNLRAEPHVTVALNGKSAAYLAREVHGEEYDQCWRKAGQIYGGYEKYKTRAGREIAVFKLEPVK